MKYQGIFCEAVSLSTVRSYIHEVSVAWLPKHELNKNNNNGLLKWTGESPWGINTKSYRQLMNAENGRNIFPWGRAHQLVIQYQIVTSENISVQVTFFRLSRLYLGNYLQYPYPHIHMDKTTIKTKPWIWKRVRSDISKALKLSNYATISKIKYVIKNRNWNYNYCKSYLWIIDKSWVKNSSICSDIYGKFCIIIYFLSFFGRSLTI